MPLMGQAGMGIPLEENAPRRGGRRRGQFVLRGIEAINPLTGKLVLVLGRVLFVCRAVRVAVCFQALSGPLDRDRFWGHTRGIVGSVPQRRWLDQDAGGCAAADATGTGCGARGALS